ncbi:MAG: small hydrophobic protein [Bacilli bacterium]|nr:small hydrophobic protein [Bacilli bacterium]
MDSLNEKYRPIKLWIILIVLIAFGTLFGGFLMDG